ncbi:hypothetical protein VNO77_25014 [Canavalia gladiata]|uniref:Uncharacterized protein n=1 Tax=Canavalia gladiata TaxID=3824 RepID=A0AAN9L801_CANGL
MAEAEWKKRREEEFERNLNLENESAIVAAVNATQYLGLPELEKLQFMASSWPRSSKQTLQKIKAINFFPRSFSTAKQELQKPIEDAENPKSRIRNRKFGTWEWKLQRKPGSESIDMFPTLHSSTQAENQTTIVKCAFDKCQIFWHILSRHFQIRTLSERNQPHGLCRDALQSKGKLCRLK